MIYYIFLFVLSALAIWLSWKIAQADFRRRIIPDAYLFPLMLIGLTFVVFFPWICTIQDAVLGGTFGYLLSAITGYIFDKFIQKKQQNYISPIGMGDIKLLGVGGLWLGTTGLSIALIISCILGTAWGMYKKEKYIPFAPFFITGGFLSLIILAFLI